MLNYGERLERKATSNVSLFVPYDNRQSSKGFNSNSLRGEAYHRMFTLQIKEQLQILNDNNNFCRIDLVTVLTAFLTSRQSVKYVHS